MGRRKKPAGRERERPRETIYTRPHWFNRAHSLCQLYGWPRPEAGDGRGLIGRYGAAIDKPVGQLGAEELVLLLTQGTDPHYLAPVALEVARARRDSALLRVLLALPTSFWRTHPVVLDAVVELAEALHEEGHAELEHELAAFVSRWREGG